MQCNFRLKKVFCLQYQRPIFSFIDVDFLRYFTVTGIFLVND